jgi:nucleoside-diphosphate-sugar epimerase
MNDLAYQVINLTKSKSKITYVALPEDDPKQRRPDITRAKELLKWEPQIQLEEGLQLTIEYFKQKLSSE